MVIKSSSNNKRVQNAKFTRNQTQDLCTKTMQVKRTTANTSWETPAHDLP